MRTARSGVWMGLVAVTLAMGAAGCHAAPVAPGADAIVVNAERSIQAAFDSVEGFLAFDHLNRATLRETAPDVHAFAEALRRTIQDPAVDPFRAAWAALGAYKAARTPDAGRRLEDAAAVVEQVARQARLYLARANPRPG